MDPDNIEEALKIEEIYKGALLGERAYLWSLHETERYYQLYHSFVKKISENLLKMREYLTASHLLKKLLLYNELDEEIVALLMRAKAGINDRKALQQIFKQYEKVLKKELKMIPSNELISLYHKLLNQKQPVKRFKKKKRKRAIMV